MRARGTFEVSIQPLPTRAGEGGLPTRNAIDKVFTGDLEGTSSGEMLAVLSPVKGSAGYVAIEIVTGKLGGRSGTFALQHSGLMNRGAPSLRVTVIPDTGTGELIGIAGTLTIDVSAGHHAYEFEYTLPEPGSPAA